jgi:hypothetical protein
VLHWKDWSESQVPLNIFKESTLTTSGCFPLFTLLNILHEIRKRKANWIGHILRRNCFLKEVIEGKIKGRIEVTRRRGRRRKHLLDDLGDRRGYSYLKEGPLNRIYWRNRFGRSCGPVVWQITDDDENVDMYRLSRISPYKIFRNNWSLHCPSWCVTEYFSTVYPNCVLQFCASHYHICFRRGKEYEWVRFNIHVSTWFFSHLTIDGFD